VAKVYVIDHPILQLVLLTPTRVVALLVVLDFVALVSDLPLGSLAGLTPLGWVAIVLGVTVLVSALAFCCFLELEIPNLGRQSNDLLRR